MRIELFEVSVGVRQALKKGISWGFSPKKWIGLDHVKSNGKICKELAQGLFDQRNKVDGKHGPVIKGLHGEALVKRAHLARILALIYSLFVIGLISYAWYLGFDKGLVLASIISLGISFLFVSYGMRELMLYAQFKLRKNKISCGEALQIILKGPQ